MKRSALIGILIVLLGLITLSLTLFTVDQTQQAIILELQKPKRVITDPGLHFRVPFILHVKSFERRLLQYDAAPSEAITQDKKNLIVDNYSRWRIVDPLKFLTSVRTEGRAQSRLDDIIYSNIRQELGRYTLTQIVSVERAEIMKRVTELSNQQAAEYGIEIVDVRIKRADLPDENENAVFGRMQAERQRQAKQYRSEGEEEAQKIRAEAEREKEVILAEAYREAQILRGTGDAEAARIYARAYNRDPAFFALVRSLESYKKTLPANTTILLDPNSEYFRYLKRSR